MKADNPVLADLPDHARRMLNAIAGRESGGRYNIRYTPSGGATFDSFDAHPGIFEPGPHGPSSAAGRYQITKTTWNRLPAEVKGDGKFTPENQDRAAWWLAQNDYRSATGRDLSSDLQSGGLTPSIVSSLAPTWQAFGSSPSVHIAAYNANPATTTRPAVNIMSDDEIDQMYGAGTPQAAEVKRIATDLRQKGLPSGSQRPQAVAWQGEGDTGQFVEQSRPRSDPFAGVKQQGSPATAYAGVENGLGPPLPPRRPADLGEPWGGRPEGQINIAQALSDAQKYGPTFSGDPISFLKAMLPQSQNADASAVGKMLLNWGNG